MQYLFQAGLVDYDPEIGILEALPPASRRIVIAEVTQSLAANPAFCQQLLTVSHVKWYLEAVGAAFGLGLEDVSVMGEATDIFVSWLTDPQSRPAAWKEFGDNKFEETMLRLISLLFVPRRSDTRSQTTGAIQKHVELSRKSLQAISEFTQKPGLDSFSKQQYLRIIVGICDSLLSIPSLPFVYLAEELPDDLLTLSLSTFVRFEILDEKSWIFLHASYRRWAHRPQAIGHWQYISQSISEAVIKRLYSTNSITEHTIIYQKEQFSISDEIFLVSIWDKIIDLLPFPSKMSPTNFCRAVAGVEKVITTLTCLSPEEPLAPSELPDANSILRLFGDWLFEAVTNGSNKESSEGSDSEGRAMAIGTLCRIFSQPHQRTPILPMYLEKFYAAIHSACTKTNGDLFPLVMVIISSEELFSADLAGSRILIASIINGIRKVIPASDEELLTVLGKNVRLNLIDLRRSCYKILMTVFAAIGHYSEGSLPSLIQSFPLYKPTSSSYYSDAIRKVFGEQAVPADICDMKAALFETVFDSLVSEADSGNTRYLISVLSMFLFDDARTNPDLIPLSIKLLGDQLEQMKWNPDVCPAAFLAISQLSTLQPLVSATAKDRPRKLILSLCRFGDALVSAAAPHTRSLLPGLIQAILTWSLQGDWLDADFECQAAILDLFAECSISAFVSLQTGIIDSVQEVAEAAISRFMLRHSRSSVPLGSKAEHSKYFALLNQRISCFTDTNNGHMVLDSHNLHGGFSFKQSIKYGGLSSSFVPEDLVGNGQFDAPAKHPLAIPSDIFLQTPCYNSVFQSVSESNNKLSQRLHDLSEAIKGINIASADTATDFKIQRPFRSPSADTEYYCLFNLEIDCQIYS